MHPLEIKHATANESFAGLGRLLVRLNRFKFNISAIFASVNVAVQAHGVLWSHRMKVAYRPVTCPQIRLLFLIQIWTRGKALLSSGWAEHRLRGRPFFVRAYSSNFKVIGSEIFFLAFVEL